MASQAAPLFTLFVQAGKENSRPEKLGKEFATEPSLCLSPPRRRQFIAPARAAILKFLMP